MQASSNLRTNIFNPESNAMKTISSIILIAVIASFTAPQAQANKEGRALLGGIIGGIILGNALADNEIHTSVHVSNSYGHHGNGYYDWVSVKTWVPGHYERRYDNCGNRYKAWISGHHSYVRQKVWVESRRQHRREHYSNQNRHSDHRRGHYDRSDSHRRNRHGDHNGNRNSRRSDSNRRGQHVRNF